MNNRFFDASVVTLDSDRFVAVTSSKYRNNVEDTYPEVTYNAKVTLSRDDEGNLSYLIQPHAKTGTHRYEPVFDLEHGSVTTTKQDIRVVLKFPRRGGFMAAAYHLIGECTRIANFFMNHSINHYGL